MFLKRVELFGFKSFADKTVIEFTDGISALLGPNGCGKSNVVDAIKWVLGEQATKSLRADKMEDIIFNGTEDRKALNVAEVTLTLENNANLLSLDEPEIAVKRRLFRSGDSEYYINSTPVKLKDLRELFLDTGIGKSAYSIMEQGKIDQILSTKPEERRYIFEEAASITKFKARGQEADRKLRKTDENIRQVEGILTEVKRSYDSLKKQADKTTEYHGLRQRRFEVERDLTLIRLREFMEKRDKKNRDLEEIGTKRQEIKQGIDAINEILEANLDQVNSMESELNDSNKRLYGLTIEKSNISSQIGIINERVRELEEKIQSDKAREEQIKLRVGELSGQMEQKKQLVGEYTRRLEELSQNIDEFTKRISSSEQRVAANVDEEKKLELSNLDLDVQMAELQTRLQGLTDDIVRELDEQLGQSEVSIQAQVDAEQQLRHVLGLMSKSVDRHRQMRRDLAGAEDRGAELAAMFDKALDELGEVAARSTQCFEEYRKTVPDFIRDFLSPQGIITQKREIDTQLSGIREQIGANRTRIGEIGKENSHLRTKIEEYRATLQELLVNQERSKAQQQAIQTEADSLSVQIQEQEALILDNRQRIAEDEGRLNGLKGRIGELETERKNLEKSEKDLQKELQQLEKGISSKNKDLTKKEKDLQKSMEQLGKTQTQHERLQVELSEANLEIRNLYSNFRERYSRDLSEFEQDVFEHQFDQQALKDEGADIREKLKSLGSVNLMAVEEFAEIKERYDFLSSQLEDLSQAKKDLVEVTAQIREESARQFLETYEKIKKNFHSMFRRLFGGGRGELRLSDPEQVLESGIEIFAQPPGKKLENITLLSGGERSLTAVALLFATYMVKPSPFCLLDEIDAALDESNVGRFVNMLMEFANTSQFIVITHNKKTVAGARTLLGVTMEESGVSKAVAIRLGSEADNPGAKMYHQK